MPGALPITVDSVAPLCDLLRDAQAGARPAFEQIYARFARTVHGIVLSHAGPADAEDLTQEVFLSAYTNLATVRSADALPGWLCALARNAAVDHLRRVGRRPRRVELSKRIAAPDERDRELVQRVLALLDELPSAYREPLVLRLVEGMTGPEIAAHTGMTPGSVRVNLCRGLARLRPLLEKEGFR